jgi:pimeloyl-ACP methyl ester carboxylesterase
LHGFPQHWWEWRKVIPPLAERYRVVAPDLRGAGWTDAPADGYTVGDVLADVLALPPDDPATSEGLSRDSLKIRAAGAVCCAASRADGREAHTVDAIVMINIDDSRPTVGASTKGWSASVRPSTAQGDCRSPLPGSNQLGCLADCAGLSRSRD